MKRLTTDETVWFKEKIERGQSSLQNVTDIKQNAALDEQHSEDVNSKLGSLLRGTNPRTASSEAIAEISRLFTLQNMHNEYRRGHLARLDAALAGLANTVRELSNACKEVASPYESAFGLPWMHDFACADHCVEATALDALAQCRAVFLCVVEPPPPPVVNRDQRFPWLVN